jgi:hypothetical protein
VISATTTPSFVAVITAFINSADNMLITLSIRSFATLTFGAIIPQVKH